ncbi:hypothetical protein GQ457_10G003680 [Hibiscus cannabinus]
MGEANFYGRRIVSLFVNNLPPYLHWSGLRQVFGRQGDIVDSFIAKKLDKSGKRFGFVRFSNRADAERAIERLNGFNLFGFRLSVAVARYNTRTTYWRKVFQDKMQHKIHGEVNASNLREPVKHSKPIESMEASSRREVKSVYRIEGFVEEEALFKLNKCAVGTMATICSISSVEERLIGWGFGELSLKSLGGRCFLIEFKDQELFDYLKEQKWSYLLEVFSEVEPWSELFHLPERITWIQAEGIPLHCWNQITFKRIAEIWGSMLALGENGNQSLDGEKVTILISTKQRINLDGVLELEVGRECYLIRINMHSVIKMKEENRNTKNLNSVQDKEESSSESSSVKDKGSSPVNLDSRKSLADDSMIALSTGNTKAEAVEISRHVGEELISGYSKFKHTH